MNTVEAFKRYEKKYIINQTQNKELMSDIKRYVEKDKHGFCTISNIYYDTDNYDLIRASIEKPVYKEKLRLRSYCVPNNETKVFLELKKKFDGIVYKRRLTLSYTDAQNYLDYQIKPLKEGQILNEIDWFMRRYKLSPKVFIAYDRAAFLGKSDANLRVTFDNNIRFRQNNLELQNGNYGQQIIDSSQTLMEIKFSDSIPIWLAEILNDLKIYPASFSKYGNCYKKFILNKKEGIKCLKVSSTPQQLQQLQLR